MISFKNDVTQYHKYRNKKTIFFSIGIGIFIIGIITVAIQLLKYQVEGEKRLPFEFSNMLIVSTADGIGKENSENRWDISILQNNDIYMEIKKTTNDSLRKITLENFLISNGPEKGEPKIYHPTTSKDLIYLYKDENLVDEKLEYNVSSKSNIKKLEISGSGGIVSFSSCSNNIENYISNEDTEVQYDGKLLSKVEISEEQVQYDLQFDIIVEMESKKKYKSTINLKLPLEGLITEGTVQKEIENFDDFIFKRI